MLLNIEKLECDLYKKTDTSLRKKAEEYIERNRVKILNVYSDGNNKNIIQIYGQYIDKNYFSPVTVYINFLKSEITESNCGCRGWQYRRQKTLCVHSAALIMYYIEMLKEVQRIEKERYDNMGINCINEIKSADMPKSRLSLDIIIDKFYDDEYVITFKIGCKRMYVLKNINQLIEAKNNEEDLFFGKDFTYSPLSAEFNEQDEQILDYIEELSVLNTKINYTNDQLIKGKELRLPKVSLRRFLNYLDGRTIMFNGDKCEVTKADIPIQFEVNKNKNKYILKIIQKGIYSLTPQNDVYLFEGKIYLPSKKQMKTLSTYLKYISQYGEIQFKPENQAELFNNVIGRLTASGTEVQIDKKIDNLVKQELNAEFFLDYSKKKMILDVNLKYGNEVLKFYNQSDKTEKIVIRDNLKEQQILDTINQLNFSYDKDKFKFDGSEEEFYDFLVENYKKLEG